MADLSVERLAAFDPKKEGSLKNHLDNLQTQKNDLC